MNSNCVTILRKDIKTSYFMRRGIIVIVALLCLAIRPAQAQTDTLLNRYKQYILNTIEPEGDMRQSTISLNEKHQWNDINYKDSSLANWQLLNHLKRIRDLALVWTNPRSGFYKSEATWKTIDAALDLWLEKRYKNPNWWHNEIGVPQYMRDIIILLKEKLSPQQLHDAMEVLAQFHVQGSGAGANLTWSADLGFHYGLLTNNWQLMQKCRDLLLKEIKITTGEGVQPDFSFHQHGNRLQMYQYGEAFLLDNVRLAWELRGTSLSFPEEKIRILSDFVLKGWQWMARGINTIPGTMDRSASRKDALKSADIRKLIPYLCEINPAKATDFKAIADRQNGKGSLEGYRYYPYSDFTAYQQKDFSFFLKTISDRTLPTESINRENLKGHLLNSGDAYLVRDGNEYFNLMPVWKWEYLPGVTSFKGADHIKRTEFSGSVSDGGQGFIAMDYRLEDKDRKKSVSARKFWGSHDNLVICLVADLEIHNTGEEVYTTLDQCRWRADVSVNKVKHILSEGSYPLDRLKWMYHSGFAYIPLKPARVDLTLTTLSGSWKSINNSLPDSVVEEKIFMPVLPLKEGSSGYVMASCPSARSANWLAKKHPWKVLRNDKNCQAVKFEDGTLMAAFYSSGYLTLKGNKKLEVDKPCLVLISENKLYANDPTQKGGPLSVKFMNKPFYLQLSDHGFSTKATLIK